MAGLSRLQFDRARRDFVVNGQPLLAHLAKHEGVDASMYQPSFGVQPNAAERLRGEAEPDLTGGHVVYNARLKAREMLMMGSAA